MSWGTLISVDELAHLSVTDDVLIVDCRFELGDPLRGQRDFAAGHIPGAVYADLDHDLSDLSKQGLGRHPLPDAIVFSSVLGRWGVTERTQVVAYDAVNGSIAARLWWMLRLVGHAKAAVLDGGFAAWVKAGLPVSATINTRREAHLALHYDNPGIVYFDELSQKLKNNSALLLDARAGARYRGEVEPIDPVAGHIPGAKNRPFTDNLDSDGRFRDKAALRREFGQLLGPHASVDVIHMCGSGVTACHNLLAMEYAGMPGSRVFAPSWSGWVSDPNRPVAKGD